MIFGCGFSQLVCWVNSKTLIPNQRLKGFSSCVSVCYVFVWCHSRKARIRDFPVANYFTVEGRDCLSAGWPLQQLPPLLVEWETVAKSLLLDHPRYDLISSGAALLWINLFHWRRKREIKSWHLKSRYWDSWPSGSIARYCSTSHSILAHSSMGHLRVSTNKAKWL